MTLTTFSLCAAAALSLCGAEAPSQTRDLRNANLPAVSSGHAISGAAGAWTRATTAPTGAKLILAGIKRG